MHLRSRFFRPPISTTRAIQRKTPTGPKRSRFHVKKRSPDVWVDSHFCTRFRAKRDNFSKQLPRKTLAPHTLYPKFFGGQKSPKSRKSSEDLFFSSSAFSKFLFFGWRFALFAVSLPQRKTKNRAFGECDNVASGSLVSVTTWPSG